MKPEGDYSVKVNSILCASVISAVFLVGGCGAQGGTGVAKPQTQTKVFPTTVKEDILQSMKLAHQGKVLNIPYAADKSLIDQVHHDWGTPRNEESAGAGIYSTYPTKYADFGFNKGGQIFDVRSYSPQLQRVRQSDVITSLGQPGDVRTYNGQTILLYTAGQRFQLLWIFPNKTALNSNPYLDHVSVFCPQDTVNIMAATQSAPSIVLDEEPGKAGSLFTFSILNKPNGYKLSELEWIGTNGRTVVNTYREAIQHGESGGIVPNFQISGDGSTMGFDYSTAMAGEKGKVIVIYQSSSGQAMIGESDKITLK